MVSVPITQPNTKQQPHERTTKIHRPTHILPNVNAIDNSPNRSILANKIEP